MDSDVSHLSGRSGLAAPEPRDRAAAAAALGVGAAPSPEVVVALHRLALEDTDARVRSTALAALVRVGPRTDSIDTWRAATRDPDPSVRRRAAELGPALRAPSRPLTVLLADRDPLVAEAAAFALGERGARAGTQAIAALATAATSHADALVREASVAALGAVGDARGAQAVLAACHDKPAIRRRAVLALAAFDGPEVEAAIRHALDDVDWQVRQAAEDLVALE